jgi:hypothetical protein
MEYPDRFLTFYELIYFTGGFIRTVYINWKKMDSHLIHFLENNIKGEHRK